MTGGAATIAIIMVDQFEKPSFERAAAMARSTRLSRRGFLAASAVTSVGLLRPGHVLGANEKIRVGLIGVGNQGSNNLRAFLPHVVAVCDVDAQRLGVAKEKVEKANGRCLAFADYRKMLDSKEVDAVVITTPDHWHALPTIEACAAGKDVYCEKPLSLTIAEGQAMVAAARKYDRVVQTGTQQRSHEHFRRVVELVRNGKLGDLKVVRAGIANVNFKGPAVPDAAPPKELDYELWLGPAPARPYNVNRVHYNFRFFWDYSGGQLTNWGAHHIDIAQWAMGTEDTGPVAIEGTAKYHPKGWYEVPMDFLVKYRYANGLTLEAGMRIPDGATFVGSEGTINVTRKAIKADPPDLLKRELSAGDFRVPVSDSHSKNWLDAVRSRKRPIADVEIGHRSASVCHLGNIAIRTGRPIKWDPSAEKIVDDAAAQKMIERPYRAPWKNPTV